MSLLTASRHSALRHLRSSRRASHVPFSPTTSFSASFLARLASTLAILEQKDGKLLTGSLGAVAAAQKLGGSVTGFLAGSSIKGAAEEAGKVEGLDKIIVVENGDYEKVQLCLNQLNEVVDVIDINTWHRVWPRTTRPCWSRTSKRATSPTSLPVTRRLERA